MHINEGFIEFVLKLLSWVYFPVDFSGGENVPADEIFGELHFVCAEEEEQDDEDAVPINFVFSLVHHFLVLFSSFFAFLFFVFIELQHEECGEDPLFVFVDDHFFL